MQLPDGVKATRARYVAKCPVPQGAPGPEIEESVRRWSIGLAEQVAFEHPGEGWGTKRADPNRPISKDGLAKQDGGRLLIFDMVTGAGTGAGRLVDHPESEDITGQVFVAVIPTNHLGSVTAESVPGDVGPQPPAPSDDLGPVVSLLKGLAVRMEAVEALCRQHLTGQTALEVAYQRMTEDFAGLSRQIDALDQKEVHVTLPDGTLRIGGRAVGVVDYPDPQT